MRAFACRATGGLTTKIHALVDAEGRPIRLTLTPGQAGDAPVGTAFVAGLDEGATLIADRAYDTNPIREGAAARGVWANIIEAFGKRPEARTGVICVATIAKARRKHLVHDCSCRRRQASRVQGPDGCAGLRAGARITGVAPGSVPRLP